MPALHLGWPAAAGPRRSGLYTHPASEALLLAAVTAAVLVYYFSPSLLLAGVASAALLLLLWVRLDLGLLVVLAAAPLYRFPRTIDIGQFGASFGREAALEISLAEYALLMSAAAWALRRLFAAPGAAAGARTRGYPWLVWAPPAALIAAGAFSLPFAEHKQVALREFRVVVVEPALYYALLVDTLRDRRDVLRFLFGLAAVGTAVAAYGLYHYFFVGVVEATGGVRRILAVYHSPNALALFLGRVIPVAAVLGAGAFLARNHSPFADLPPKKMPTAVRSSSPLPLGEGKGEGDPPHVNIFHARTPRPRPSSGAENAPPHAGDVPSPSMGEGKGEGEDPAETGPGGPAADHLPLPGGKLTGTLLLLSVLVMAACFYLTFSRGAWAALAAALLFPVALWRGRAVAVALGAAVLAVSLASPFLPWDRILAAGPVAQRLYVWQAALNMAVDHPLTGVGLDNFLYHYPTYMLPQAALEPDISHPHNLFLDFWTRLGILGLAVAAGLQYLFWFMAARIRRVPFGLGDRLLALALTSSMVDFLVHGLIDNSYFLIDLAFLFWLTCGLLAVLYRAQAAPARSLGA